jgi:hypothetical protein
LNFIYDLDSVLLLNQIYSTLGNVSVQLTFWSFEVVKLRSFSQVVTFIMRGM